MVPLLRGRLRQCGSRCVSSRLLPCEDGTFDSHATLLLLTYAATSNNSELPLDQLAAALTEIGWRHADGRPVGRSAFYRLPAFDVLINVSDHLASWDERRRISPAAATLARAALRRVRGADERLSRSCVSSPPRREGIIEKVIIARLFPLLKRAVISSEPADVAGRLCGNTRGISQMSCRNLFGCKRLPEERMQDACAEQDQILRPGQCG